MSKGVSTSCVQSADLEFNLFVTGELEIISGNKISDKEKKGRIKLLKKISYFYELYEWKCIKKVICTHNFL
jgi:hypothetical protein